MASELAIVGSGQSAEKFLEKYPQPSFSLFTSSGEGQLRDVRAQPLSSLIQDSFKQIFICIHKYHEVLENFNFDNLQCCIHWYDSLQDKLFPVTDPWGDSINDPGYERKQKGLTCIYDFRSEPLTFDFVVFLANCEIERRSRALDHINLIFAPGDYNGFNRNWNAETPKSKDFRLANIIYSVIQFIDTKVNIFHCDTRSKARKLWNSFQHKFPEIHDFLNPAASPAEQRHRYSLIVQRIKKGHDHWVMSSINPIYMNHVKAWLLTNQLNESKVVTLTLRESSRSLNRNSQLKEWFVFADYLNTNGYQVVFIRDTEKVFEPLGYQGDHRVFHAASIDLGLRQAIYRAAFANLFVINGVCAVNLFDSQVRYLMVSLLNSQYAATRERELRRIGYGDHAIFGAMPWQRVSWSKDSASNLINEFNKLVEIIDENF